METEVGIKTKRLRLRFPVGSDFDFFHALQTNTQVMHWTKNGPNKTIEKSRKQFRSMTDPSSPEVHIFIIELQGGTPLPIGIVGTFRPRELGYSIHPDHWGTGYATEAATAFCEWHRLVYPDTTMFVKCFAENLSSVKVLKRCGFTEATETELMADPAMTVDEARDTFVDRTSKYVRESE